MYQRLKKAALRSIQGADALCNRLYGWRGNPLYHSGAIVTLSFLVLLGTGLYLLIFYRIGDPYGSVSRLTEQAWAGRWIRGWHRYVSDVAVVAALVHGFRMFAQGRSWGPRALAWVSGLVLFGLVWVCGWTGYVMVWDGQGLQLAAAGARLLDALPLFSESIGRSFVSEGRPPSAFFFLNLFLHIALPIGLALVLWIHVSRVARAQLLPPRGLGWTVLGLSLVAAVALPVTMGPAADPFVVPDSVPIDLFYSFFLPWIGEVAPAMVWLVGGGLVAVVLLVPWWTAPAQERRPPPSVVDPRHCTGCEQCVQDCPYEAIAMVARDDDRPYLVARVDPALCVSCGICAGSCAPMGVGPAGRTGRDQLARVREFISQVPPRSSDVVVIGCNRACRPDASGMVDGSPVFDMPCIGGLHSSVIELLVRTGWGGVLVASCPERDCWNREGPRWTRERMYEDREAELQERVDRTRVRLVSAIWAGQGWLIDAIRAFRSDVGGLTPDVVAEADPRLDEECEVGAASMSQEGP